MWQTSAEIMKEKPEITLKYQQLHGIVASRPTHCKNAAKGKSCQDAVRAERLTM